MSIERNGRATLGLGQEVLAFVAGEESVLYAGTVLSALGDRVKVRLRWVSDGRRILTGSTKDFASDAVLPPQTLVTGLMGIDAQFMAMKLATRRADAALTLVGFWQAFHAQSKADAIRDLIDALQVDTAELSRSVYGALIASDAEQNGVEPWPLGQESESGPHDPDEHAQFDGCRYCNATVAATHRAMQGRVTGIKAVARA